MGLATVIGRLVDEFAAIGQEVVGVVGIGVTILAHIAVTVVEHQALAATRVAGHLVVIDESCAPLIALAVVEKVAETAVHAGPCRIASTGERRVAALALVEVEREVGAEVDGVVGVHLPLDAEVTTQVVTLVAGSSVGIVVTGRVLEEVLACRAGSCVAVTVAIHDVTTHAEVLIVLAADIEINTGILRRGHATVTTKSLETARGPVTKAQVIHIVTAT